MPACPKPRPKLLDKLDSRATVRAIDAEENAIVRARSGGRCEVRTAYLGGVVVKSSWICPKRAAHIHHLISGIGRRNIGDSIKAAHKLHICELHHAEIHGHVLKPTDDATRYSAATVRYERVSK